MCEPTMLFRPFGIEGPKIVLFGEKTGDWNPVCFQEPGDHKRNTGLYFRLDNLSHQYGFRQIAMPTLTDCNTKVCCREDFAVSIQDGFGTVVLERGVRADGMILEHSFTGAIASADCPTIVVCCPTSKSVIVAHGGCKSLIDVNHILFYNPPRENESVVDEIMKMAKLYRFCQVKVFITCGISGKNYAFPDLIQAVTDRFGKDCVSDGSGIDLKKVIAKQFSRYNVLDITTDILDTYGDCNIKGEPLWHSYRRNKTPERNLVLVIN